jgi:hypothetical protein
VILVPILVGHPGIILHRIVSSAKEANRTEI